HRNAEPGSAVDSQERAILQVFFRFIFLQIWRMSLRILAATDRRRWEYQIKLDCQESCVAGRHEFYYQWYTEWTSKNGHRIASRPIG
ncbi:MAG: hypothetical protein WB853_13805, partial [Desulfobacterales bacterium]